MERTDIRRSEGLALEELEGQHAELLPDRIEMRRRGNRRRHTTRFVCFNVFQAGESNPNAVGNVLCFRAG